MGNKNTSFFLGDTFEGNENISSFVNTFCEYIIMESRYEDTLFRFKKRNNIDEDVLKKRAKDVEKLKKTITQTNNSQVIKAYPHDVVTSLFFDFLAECPSSILPFELYLKLHKADHQYFERYIEIYLDSFSDFRRGIIMNLFHLFHDLLQPDSAIQNKLSLTSLASIFGPLLFQATDQITNYTALTNLFNYVINNFYQLNITPFPLLEDYHQELLINTNNLEKQIYELDDRISHFHIIGLHSFNNNYLMNLFHFYQRRKLCYQRGRFFYFWRYYTFARRLWREIDHIKTQIQMVSKQYAMQTNIAGTNPNIINGNLSQNIIKSEYDRNRTKSEFYSDNIIRGAQNHPINTTNKNMPNEIPPNLYTEISESKIIFNDNLRDHDKYKRYSNNMNANHSTQYQTQLPFTFDHSDYSP